MGAFANGEGPALGVCVGLSGVPVFEYMFVKH